METNFSQEQLKDKDNKSSEKLVSIYIPVYIFPGLSILFGSKLFFIF